MMAKAAGIILILIILAGSVFGLFFIYPMFPSTQKQAVLVVGQNGNQIKIADTWLQGNITTDSATTPFRTTTQNVFGSVFRLSTIGSVNSNGKVAYDVYAVSYNFQNVCTQLLTGQHVDCSQVSVDTSLIDYRLSVTVSITAQEVNGTATYNIQQPTQTTEQMTFARQGLATIAASGIQDISSILRQKNAPYGDYLITVSVNEEWEVWAQDLSKYLGQIDMLLCWVTNGLGDPKCVGIYRLEGPFTVPIEPQTATVTFGSSTSATFYLATPDSITIGTLDGQTQAFTVSLLPWNGFTGVVHLTFEFPAGITLNGAGATETAITVPAPPIQYLIQANSQTELGNYTITTTAISGGITRTKTTSLIVVQHGTNINPTQNTQLTATTDQQIYAQLAPVSVTGKLTTANDVPIPNAPIVVQIQGTTSPTTVATGSDGSYKASVFAPNQQGTYTVNVEFKGNSQYGPASTIVTFVVRQPVLSDYLVYIVLGAIIIISIIAVILYLRKGSKAANVMVNA